MSNKHLNIIPYNVPSLSEFSTKKLCLDNITGSHFNTDRFKLSPYQVVWLSLLDLPYEK